MPDCSHPEVVPTRDPNWGRCTACGDSTFPLTAWAAGWPVPAGVPIGLDELLATKDRWLRDHLAQRPGWWRLLARAAWQAELEQLAVMPLGEVAARMRGA